MMFEMVVIGAIVIYNELIQFESNVFFERNIMSLETSCK